jgi:hypothetical protein
MTNPRTKGAGGEREAAILIARFLGIDRERVTRNWQMQAAVGGSDLVIDGLESWAIEVKRAKVARISAWWRQAKQQGARSNLKPVLLYRLDRQDWNAVISLFDLRPDLSDRSPITMSLESWCALAGRDGIKS